MANVNTQYKQLQEGLLDSAHKVWLAGLGALSFLEENGTRAFRELEERGSKVFRELEENGSRMFNDLVDKGREVESETRDGVTRARKQAESTFDKLEGRLEERLRNVAQRLGVPGRDEARTLTRRVEELTAQVEELRKRSVTQHNVYHVVPEGDSWSVKLENLDRALSARPTKSAAVSDARDLAKDHRPSRLVIHKTDGTIQTVYSYEEEAAN
jgi:poly(hydroxyalkanoate) granule-associated protein